MDRVRTVTKNLCPFPPQVVVHNHKAQIQNQYSLPSPMYSTMKSSLLIDSAASTPQPQSSVCKNNNMTCQNKKSVLCRNQEKNTKLTLTILIFLSLRNGLLPHVSGHRHPFEQLIH